MDNLPIITNLKNVDSTKNKLYAINDEFCLRPYKPKNNLNTFIKSIYMKNPIKFMYMLKKRGPNFINFDLNFCRKANLLNFNNKVLIQWLISKGLYEGILIHPKQLENLYPNIELYQDHANEIIVKKNEKYYYISDFCNELYHRNLESFLCDFKILQFPNNSLKKKKIFIILFWGNFDIGMEILKNILCYKFDFNLLIVKRKGINIPMNLKNYVIIETNEYGNDIIPSLIGYYFINQSLEFDYILKIQTKSEESWRNPLVNFFKNKTENELIQLLKNKEYICHPKFSRDITTKLVNKKFYTNLNWENKQFPAGSIYFCRKTKFDNILKFIKTNHIKFFIQNMYDNHYILQSNSPIHFLERLVGINLNSFNSPKSKTNLFKYELKNILFYNTSVNKQKKENTNNKKNSHNKILLQIKNKRY